MEALDWSLIALYLTGMLALSAMLGRGHRSLADYYLGGRRLPWWSVGISVLATQSSAISFLSVPAFVAVAANGGLHWLQYELALPLAMLFLGAWLLPRLRAGGYVTIYAYLEARFDAGVRRAVALTFALARGLATGVAIYATAIVMQVSLGLPLGITIALIGVVTVLYDVLGGMSAVVVSDVLQALMLLLGLGLLIAFAADSVGGLGPAVAQFPAARAVALGGPDVWAYALGGVFLYASYYGCDQSQAQRLLAARNEDGARAALALNGIARYPLTLAYVLLGVVAYAVLQSDEGFAANVAASGADYLVPSLILEVLPGGVRGLLYAALLAAAMSSLDSAINGLSASTVQDFIAHKRRLTDRDALRVGRLTTLAWGAAVTVFAFFVGDLSPTVIESINRIGSAFYGPVLSVFVLATLPRRAPGQRVVAALAVGVATNIALWLFVRELHWMWWNLIGFLVTGSVATIGARRVATQATTAARSSRVSATPAWFWGAMLGWWVLVVGVTAALGTLASA